jgi:hypothetical protein
MPSSIEDFYSYDCNIEAICPYQTDCYHTFTWHRDDNVVIIAGYDPEDDPATDWFCHCGHYETGGFHCTECGGQPPWGCDCSQCTVEMVEAEEDEYEYDRFWEPEV